MVLRVCPTSRIRASSVCVLGLSDAVCDSLSHRQTRDLPVSAQGACVHAQGLRPRQVQKRLAIPTFPVLPSAPFNSVGTQKWPPLARWWFNFAAIPGLHVLLSTLHPHPYGRRYMTRRQCGSLLLHCMKLSFTTP